jgi:hypothetical protein
MFVWIGIGFILPPALLEVAKIAAEDAGGFVVVVLILTFEKRD